MPATAPLIYRQASALLAAHLDGVQQSGKNRIWLRPGTSLEIPPPPVEPIGLPPVQSGLSKREALDALATEAALAPEPMSLGTLRDTFVFATGNPEAELMFIGEAPGAEEERRREPFVGPAGELLNKILTAMGLQRDKVYISNILKHRPKIGEGDQGSANRKPTPREMEVCLPVVQREIEIIQPKVIVALGGTAYAGLTGDHQAKVGQVRGKLREYQGIPMIATFHPSYLLRQDDPTVAQREKRKLWEDMLLVMEKLGLPISDKQRGFFSR